MNTDRRRSDRRPAKLRVELDGRFANTADISENGLLATGTTKPVGSTVFGVLHAGQQRLSFSGEVRWSQPGSTVPGELPRAGIRLLRIDSEYRHVLERA